MDVTDETLLRLYRISPLNVPITKIGRCLDLLSDDDRGQLIRSLGKRRPRSDRERQVLLHYALTKGVGGLAFIDYLGGFDQTSLPN